MENKSCLNENKMSVFALIDFFDKEIEATNELKTQLQSLKTSIVELQIREGNFLLLQRALEHIERLLTLISVTEQLRETTEV